MKTIKQNYLIDAPALELIHEDIPDRDVEAIREGWKKYYLGPLRAYLEGSSKP